MTQCNSAFAGGHISGGHYNPAVSLAVLLRRRVGAREAAAFILTQLVAALAAAALARSLYDSELGASSSPDWRTGLFEGLFTFALGFVVLNVATLPSTEGNSYFGLAIGVTVSAGALVSDGLSIAAFNPAVALSGAATETMDWGGLWIYWLAELLGCAMAALFYCNVARERA
jgi:aquaporin Z